MIQYICDNCKQQLTNNPKTQFGVRLQASDILVDIQIHAPGRHICNVCVAAVFVEAAKELALEASK